MKPNETRDLKRQYKRTLIFLGVFFVFALILCYILINAGITPVVSGVIIVLCASIFYLLFLFICAKIDKKRAERLDKEAVKDPFTKK